MAKRGKVSRRARRVSRKVKKSRRASRRQSGGWLVLNPAAVDDVSMSSSSALSAAQGKEFASIHAAQHGGGAPLVGAPLGTSGMLDSSLREAARVLPLDQATAAIQGMSDQSGGARRRRKGRRPSRKAKKSRKGRKSSRRMRGGAGLNPSDVNAPGALLTPDMEAKALTAMNPEWKLAADPTAFAPKSA